jgi:hypothetical protein
MPERRDQEDQDCAVDSGRAYWRTRHCSAQRLQKLEMHAQSGARTRLVGRQGLLWPWVGVKACDGDCAVNGTRMRSATLCRERIQRQKLAERRGSRERAGCLMLVQDYRC